MAESACELKQSDSKIMNWTRKSHVYYSIFEENFQELFYFKQYIYLAALGLSSSTWDLRSSLLHCDL